MNRLKPELVLRLSLALTYFYSGYSLLTSPKSWTQFAPLWFRDFLDSLNFPLTAFVQVQGAIEIIMALVFVIWFMPRRWVRYAAFLSSLEMGLILFFTGIDLITFRDIGLLGLSFAIFLIYRERN
ncbi:MAG: hypothetical protein AAB415_02430 [Patescibacteria group bacterium]